MAKAKKRATPVPLNPSVRRDNRIDRPELGRAACGGGFRVYAPRGGKARSRRGVDGRMMLPEEYYDD